MNEYVQSEHAHSSDDDATTFRHLAILIGGLVVIAFGIAGLVAVVV